MTAMKANDYIFVELCDHLISFRQYKLTPTDQMRILKECMPRFHLIETIALLPVQRFVNIFIVLKLEFKLSYSYLFVDLVYVLTLLCPYWGQAFLFTGSANLSSLVDLESSVG